MPSGSTDKSKYDLDELYHDVGQAVVLFQTLESALWQLGVAALGPDQFDQARRKMSGHSFHQLCKTVREAVGARAATYGKDNAMVVERLDVALAECDSLRRRRNQFMHSTYVFFEAGEQLHGIMRSDIRPAPHGGLHFDQEDLEPASFSEFHRRLAMTCWSLGQLRLQVSVWPT